MLQIRFDLRQIGIRLSLKAIRLFVYPSLFGLLYNLRQKVPDLREAFFGPDYLTPAPNLVNWRTQFLWAVLLNLPPVMELFCPLHLDSAISAPP